MAVAIQVAGAADTPMPLRLPPLSQWFRLRPQPNKG